MGEVCELRLSTQERIELERCLASLDSASAREGVLANALFEYLLADWLLRAEGARQGGMSPRELTALLEKGRRERLPIAELAREAGMCERSFRDAVHAATGMSPKSYMLRGEMTAAMELLRTSGMSISEIASCFNYLNCQVKCNTLCKKTSSGVFQPRHLRGRRLSNFATSFYIFLWSPRQRKFV